MREFTDEDLKIEMIINKIKHYLITTYGKTITECSPYEFYRAFCLALREDIMINWTASLHTLTKYKSKVLHYLCMEYMPGRMLANNLMNLHSQDLINLVLARMGKKFADIAALEVDPGLGNGGLGRLAACLLDAMATQDYPVIGYGLRYQYGIFDQEIWNGLQVERPEIWLLHENPWEFRRDNHAVHIPYCGHIIPVKNVQGEEVYELRDSDEVRAVSYDYPILGFSLHPNFNVSTLRLWTTKESPRNFQLQRFNAGLLDQAAENTSLTDVLYPNDNNETGKRIRLKQEFLLASASVQDILHHFDEHYDDVRLLPEKVAIHINDTHPALAIAELMHHLMYRYNRGFEESLQITQSICNYTNHTVLKESLEEWNQNRLSYLLPRHFKIIERINLDLCNKVRRLYPQDEDKVRRMSMIEGGQIKMAHLAIYGSSRVNGVANLHTELLKHQLFPDFDQMYPDKFINVTNGVTPRRWIMLANPELGALISDKIGFGWLTEFSQIKKLAAFERDTSFLQRLIEIKKRNKQKLIAYLQDHCPIRDDRGLPIACQTLLGPEALFDVQIKRIHEYKRQLMNALAVLITYNEMKKTVAIPKIKRQVIFAGKAAPGYEMAKNIIIFINALARLINYDPQTAPYLRVIFVENYNVSLAERLIPAADLSEQISTAGMEASGTGNMKLAMNGALTIGTEDGANIEMHQSVGDQGWPFGFGASAQENGQLWKQGCYSPFELYINDPKIKEALDQLKHGTFCQNRIEQDAFSAIFKDLVEKKEGSFPDRHFVLKDLSSYLAAHKRVEQLYENPVEWARLCLLNIAAMGPFSSDEACHKYAQAIWKLPSQAVDKDELEAVKQEYSEYDKCRIL
jgi:starch phosphorylase